MTISELITELEAHREKYGDLEVSYGTYYNDFSSDYLEFYGPDGTNMDDTIDSRLIIIG